MTELDHRWATLQIEALADGSLSPEAERRMRELVRDNPDLARQLNQAIALRRELRRLVKAPVPRGLGWRLWNIPSTGRRPSGFWIPAVAAAGIASLALALGLLFYMQQPSEEELAREKAAQDFALVVAYLQKSVEVARDEVNKTVSSEVVNALEKSRRAIRRSVDDADQDDAAQGGESDGI
jgi:anti-sigma factor RsiW